MTEARETYDLQEKMIRDAEEKADELRHPFGKPAIASGHDIGPTGIAQELANSLFALPNLHNIKWLELRARLGKRRLSKMYERSHEEALRLNEKHNRLLQRALEAQDELSYFEVHELGMSEEEPAIPEE